MNLKEQRRTDFPWLLPMPTRWIDNDRYGHMNNAVYYSMFENAVMTWMEVENQLDPNNGNVRCFTVENGCQYHAAVRYPEMVECAVRIARIGNSSVRYELGIFVHGRENVCATGFIADVFVDAQTERPTSIPKEFRDAFAPLLSTS